MSILPSHLEAMAAEKAKARRRNPLARTSSHTGSQSDISLAPPLVAGSPNRGGISPRASREPSPFGEIELPVPTDSSPPRSPAVVAYSDKNNARRRSTTVGTGIQDGWLERQMKLLKKRGWTMSMLAWRGAALMTVVLYLLWKWKMPSERDIDGLTMPADQISNFGGHFGGQHQFVDGYLKTHEGSHGKHPIWELLNHGHSLYRDLILNSPTSFEDAVNKYSLAYGRPPPKGFDLLSTTVAQSWPYSPLASPSQIHLYSSVTPAHLRRRTHALERYYDEHPEAERPLEDEDGGKFILVIYNGAVWAEWPWNAIGSNGAHVSGDDGGLVELVRDWLHRPEWEGKVGNMRMVIDMDDFNPQLVPYSYLEAAKHRSESNTFEVEDGPEAPWASHRWEIGCEYTSPFSLGKPGTFGNNEQITGGSYVPSFIQTPLVANYVCLHPQLQQYSEILTAYPKPLEIETRPIPQLSARSGLGPLGSEILTLGVGHRGAKKHSVGEGENVFVPWDNKVGNAVFWRGSLPVFHHPLTPHNARLSTPLRLALLPTTAIDATSFPLTLVAPVNNASNDLIGPAFPSSHSDTYFGFGLNKHERIGPDLWRQGHYLDVAFEKKQDGNGIGCEGMKGCEWLEDHLRLIDPNQVEDGSQRKYVFVLDGEDPKKAFESGSLVFHATSTGISAWQTKAVPWHDYIPVSADFSDLPSILEFLRANDDQAETIAKNGRAFAQKVLTPQAGGAAVLGQLLEYARVWSEDRGEMNYAKVVN